MLTLFSVGYVKMMRSVPSSGGFYSFISHGLGRPLGMGAGWLSVFAYAFVEGSLYGAFGYFGNITIQQFFHCRHPLAVSGVRGADPQHHPGAFRRPAEFARCSGSR